jgi:ADP-heptose:LPS heptosyltransferase
VELDGHAQKSILLIRWRSIGDVIFTLPALLSLRSNFPDSRITYLTSPEFVPLIECFSVADEICAIDRKRLRRLFKGGLEEWLKLWRVVAGGGYDLVVDFQGFGETAFLSWLTGAPERWGHVHRPSRAWAYTRPIARDEEAHPVDALLRFLSKCGLDTSRPKNAFELPAKYRAAAARLFLQFGLKSGPATVFIQPFTSTPGKDWPMDKWLALARQLRGSGVQVLFGGGPADRPRLEPALSEGFPVAAGTDLLTSCSLAARCTVVIGADTGLLHLATACGCRVILLKHLKAKECPFGHPDWTLTPQREGLRTAEIELDVVLAEIRRVIEIELMRTRSAATVEAVN